MKTMTLSITVTRQLHAIIEAELRGHSGEPVLYIRDPDLTPSIEPAGLAPSTLITALEWSDALPESLAKAGRFTLGIVYLKRRIPAAALRPLLARLRDVHCPRLVLLLSGSQKPSTPGHEPPGHEPLGQEPIGHEQLLALGFQPYPGARELARVVGIYEFDISTYKRTPRWLNPARWANPELWDKHRW